MKSVEKLQGDNEWMRAVAAEGGLLTKAQAARVAGVSRQRIGFLVKCGRLPTYKLDGYCYLGMSSVQTWRNSANHKPGRVRKPNR